MKKNMKKFIIIVAIFIAIIATIIIIKNGNLKKKEEWHNDFSEIDKTEINYQENTTVEELKEKMNIQADSSLYDITEEYDGRKTVKVKNNIQFKVAFAGIIKGEKPNLSEVDKIYNENYPTKNGIWVSINSRSKFLELLNENAKSKYYIDEEGYLSLQNANETNNYDDKIKEITNSNKKIIVDINEIDYEVDTLTGEIVEYPFEQLDERQTMDIIQDEGDKIIVLTTNKKQKITNKEIFDDFIQNL